ncbi:hypothetical protein V494_03201 [Pseudogymnoascus sp. VKM F-4513 (FW-928)]|nr:hypothetical protein V494_03201 [Pseudogymnoascus sp. VKM F-4513 (FW-928)]
MARLSPSLMLFCFLSSTLVAQEIQWTSSEEDTKDAVCNNSCADRTIPNNYCTDDIPCVCTETTHREEFFCCVIEKCAPRVFPDSLSRTMSGCEAMGLPFTLDVEKVCGVKLTITSAAPEIPTPSVTGDSTKSSTSDDTTKASTPESTSEASTPDNTSEASTPDSSSKASTSDSTSDAPSSGTSGAASEGSVTPVPNSAPQATVIFNGAAIIVATFAMLLL